MELNRNINIIAHRANLNGPSVTENTLISIENCLQNYNYDVEIDVRYINNCIHVGHDLPSKFTMDIQSFLDKFTLYKSRIWLHCKDLESIILFSSLDVKFNFFGHHDDEFVLTSRGDIFTRPDIINENVIIVMPELISDKIKDIYFNSKGILTDYPIKYETYYNTFGS